MNAKKDSMTTIEKLIQQGNNVVETEENKWLIDSTPVAYLHGLYRFVYESETYGLNEDELIVFFRDRGQRAKKDSMDRERKLDWNLLLIDLRGPLKLVAEVLDDASYREDGAYGPRNWMLGGEEFLYHLKGAIERHRTSIIEGEYLDRKSGWPHRAHIVASELFLMYFEAKEQDHE